ncbi:MAG TPA: PH domain-containing protein [Lacisediminihabitans sp.]|uniref:PH domain-containing protein n=1 Tax=Lacisediminihabitans sp. TaxID=2787631 RepID=UPI002ED8C5AB
MRSQDHEDVFHSRFNRILAIVIWALEVFVLVTTVVAGQFADQPLTTIVPELFVAGFVYVLLWRPGVKIDDEAVTLVNVLRTISVPWPALIDVDTRFSLSLRTPNASYSAWAAPAPGRTGLAMARRAERRHGSNPLTPTIGGRSRPGDLITTESGEAAYLVRERWNALVESGRVEPGLADVTPVTIRWHWAEDIALLILAAGAAFVTGWL